MERDARIQHIADRYAAMPEVDAVAISGSMTSSMADAWSDIDLCVYSRQQIPVGPRRQLAEERGHACEIDNRYWETGDEWLEHRDGRHVDVLFRSRELIEGVLDAVLGRHEAAVGYTTALWHNVRTCEVLFDREGWLAGIRERAAAPYPDALARAIIRKNVPLLRGCIGAYPNQIEQAVARGDMVSVNHRLTELLSSTFDILFAVNRVPHPGEKRLLTYAQTLTLAPPQFAQQVTALLSFSSGSLQSVPSQVTALVDGVLAFADRV